MPEGLPGWYPDPAGTPGRYRYWDGSRWSTVTTHNPRQPLPTDVGSAESPSHTPVEGAATSGRRRLALTIGVLVVLMTVIAVAVYLGNHRQADRAVPTPTGSLNASSAPPTARPSQSLSSSATPASPLPLRCPKGNPDLRARHPSDGRVYGGNLSFEEQPTFEPAALEPRFSFAYDVLQQTLEVSQDPGWIAQLAVGQLRAKDGFVDDPRSTVENLVRCVIAGKMYSPYLPTRSDIRSESLSINGHRGWLIDSEITVDRPDLPVAGDHTIFIVVRDGKDWGFFFGAVPIGNAQLDAVLARTIRGLRAS
ncbi:MAG TPA: DUF2510 domain-containing protein [Propionibacteriaceae bacterium]